ncbi:MAG: cryptochrome/photolyase family protein [Kineosporiaceae bacterium]
MATSVLWFRRDLRRADHPALLAAVEAADGGGVLPLFVLDPALWRPSGAVRRAWLVHSLRALAADLDGELVVRHGDPAEVVPAVAAAVGARSVHVTADTGPYGRRRDAAVATRLRAAGVHLVPAGTPYAVGPGSVVTGAGSPFQVFTPFSRAWQRHGWPAPAPPPGGVRWTRPVESEPLPEAPRVPGLELPPAGERAALARWQAFRDGPLENYRESRDLPARRTGTSAMSAHLKYGEIHPRTLLADLAHRTGAGPDTYRTELCWREFYADVLWHRPGSARESYRADLAAMPVDEPGETFEAWTAGRTGYPFVDAGMRQLRREGWMHNRVRMVTASFLVKDLHVDWRHGARHFLHWLRDGDLASNNHGWQWVAGTGTDAAPYFRVFNPVTQGERFDPDGEYVRRYLPEIAHLPGKAAHQPWRHDAGYDGGYPHRIVDHDAERKEALARYGAARG